MRTDDLARVALVGPRLVLLAVAVGYAIARAGGVAPGLAARSWLYLGLMVGIGLFHGGYEHAANIRGRGERFRLRYLGAYGALLAAALGVFVVAPAAGLAVAVTIVALKGGHGGLCVLEAAGRSAHLRTGAQRALAVLVRGGTVMAVPLVVHPGEFSTVAFWMLRLFGGQPGALGWVLDSTARTAIGAAFGAAVGTHLLWGYRSRRGTGRGWVIDAGETLLLIGFFTVVPPILAAGVYFAVWYGARQTGRALTAGRSREIEWGRVARSAAVRAGPLWVGGLAVFGAVALSVPVRPTGPVAWVALYSAVVSAIAVPHVLVGAWLDRRRGIWSVTA